MKNLLSNWSGRLLALLFPAALVASIFVPIQAVAIMHLSMGGGGNGAMDGDPLDTNDYGGGGGGSDIHNSGAGGSAMPLVLELGDVQFFLVTELVGGKVVFKIIAVEKIEAGLVKGRQEATHAP